MRATDAPPGVKAGIVGTVALVVAADVVVVAVAGALVLPSVVGTVRVGMVRDGTFVNVAGALVGFSFCRSGASRFVVAVAGALVALPGTGGAGGAGGAFWARAADASKAKADVRERMRVFTIILKERFWASPRARVY